MRHRLTITLSEEILRRVDKIIDGKEIRNRSHAIETTLAKNLDPKIDTAVILAGAPFKGKVMPALRKYNGRLLIDHVVDMLRGAGIVHVVICAGQNAELLRSKFPEGLSYGMRITYVDEPSAMGTAGAVLLAKENIESDSFLVLHGDIFADIDIAGFLKFYKSEGTLATIAVKPAMGAKHYGKVMLSGNQIVEFIEESKNLGISIVNVGAYILDSRVFEMIPANKKYYFESDIFPVLAKEGNLSAYFFQGEWVNFLK